jgi:hypothetical protein
MMGLMAMQATPLVFQMAKAVEAAPGVAEASVVSGARRSAIVFSGPVPPDGVLFDSERDRRGLPTDVTLSRLVVRSSARPSGEVVILLYVGDRTTPRARVRLADLLRHGVRPLNVAVGRGDAVGIVLVDPRGELIGRSLEVEIGW